MAGLTTISNHSLAGADQPDTWRAPEIEKGVGCDFDSYLLVPDNTLDERIAAAKGKLGEDVVILGHHYQRDEVIRFDAQIVVLPDMNTGWEGGYG